MNLLELMTDEEIDKEVRSESEVSVPINTEAEADRTMGKIIWAKNKKKENDEKIKAKKAELMEQLALYERRLNGPLESYIEHQELMLQAYCNNVLKGKKGSVPLFYGNARLTYDRGSVVFDDEEAVLNFLRQNQMAKDCVTLKASIRKTDFRKLFTEDASGHYFHDSEGNIIKGVHIDKKDGLQLALTIKSNPEGLEEVA